MNWPTSQDYNEAIQDPVTNFADVQLQGGEAVLNSMGLPVPRSGNFADVYQFTGADGKLWALKCFTRKVAGLADRYAKIDEHLATAKLPFTVGFKFLQRGVKVQSQWYPLLKMEWVEGFTLNDFVANNLDKPRYLHALMQMWAKLAGRLRDANMAHADLQHGNVLLVPGATPQKLGLKLIDYDGMWVPTLAETPPGEVGHPNFQHPLRLKDRQYNSDVDRFPHLVIAAALRATLIGGQALWDKFDNGDNLLFKEADFRDPANATIFKTLWELNDPFLRTLVGQIALSTKQPLRKTPWLDDVLFESGGPRLAPEQEQRVEALLGVPTVTTARAPTSVAPVDQEFNVFQMLEDADDTKPRADTIRSSRGAYSARAKQKSSKIPMLIGGGMVAAIIVAIITVVVVRQGGAAPEPPPVAAKDKGKGNTSQTKSTTSTSSSPSAVTEKPVPAEVRTVVVVDGKDELRLTQLTAQWVHHSWQFPTLVKLNSLEWNPQEMPMIANGGVQGLIKRKATDLSRAKLTKVRGRGPVTIQATKDVVTLVFDDEGPLGADTYEVIITFE